LLQQLRRGRGGTSLALAPAVQSRPGHHRPRRPVLRHREHRSAPQPAALHGAALAPHFVLGGITVHGDMLDYAVYWFAVPIALALALHGMDDFFLDLTYYLRGLWRGKPLTVEELRAKPPARIAMMV